MRETKQSNKANDTRHSLSAESGVMTYVQAPQHGALDHIWASHSLEPFFRWWGFAVHPKLLHSEPITAHKRRLAGFPEELHAQGPSKQLFFRSCGLHQFTGYFLATMTLTTLQTFMAYTQGCMAGAIVCTFLRQIRD